MAAQVSSPEDLPPDNAARIAIYDAVAAATRADGYTSSALSEEDLLVRVIGRLRILVPRELHVMGEQAYVQEKIKACIEDGLIERGAPAAHLAATGLRPRVRYPDGTVRDYDADLEGARERLESDDARLRRRGFDVRRLVPSLADRQKSADFRALVDSMHEHGYLKQFPIVHGVDGTVVDGRARIAAAAVASVKVATEKDQTPARRDTPLHRAVLVLAVNRERISDEQRQHVLDAVGQAAGRDWTRIAEDLALTREWRLADPRRYSPDFDVKKHRFREGEEPKVQVTPDGKVMLKSLLLAAGLPDWKDKQLREYVPTEEARTSFSGGKRAIFVRISDAIAGIEAMKRDRGEKGRRLDTEWNDILDWLTRTFPTPDGRHGAEASPLAVSRSSELAPEPAR
jgi:hypothetical protein